MITDAIHNVLILGDRSDPAVFHWREHCETAGVPNTVFPASGEEIAHPETPYTTLINTHADRSFFHMAHLPEPLAESLSEDCLILANALSETPTAIAARIEEAERLVGFSGIGLYTGNPVVEVARAVQTTPRTLQRAIAFLEALGLKAVEVPETPGLVLGRILATLVNEATFAVMEGVATPAEIDTAMQLGLHYPRGPLAWADNVGLDVILAILTHLREAYGDEGYCPSLLLRRKVDADMLGRKTGEGFYTYLQTTDECFAPEQ